MKSAKVLIIESDQQIAQNLCQQADQLGYTVCDISNDFLDGISKAKALQADVALLGDRRRGSADDFILSLSNYFSIPVIPLVAANETDIQRLTHHAKNGYLIQPFQIRELYAVIEAALYKARLARSLHDSEQWFIDTLHCVEDGIIAVDTHSNTRFLNMKAEEILGVTLDLSRNKPIAEILRLEEVQDLLSTEALGTELPSAIEFGKWIRDGRNARLPIDYYAAPLRDDHGKPNGAVVVIRDASTRLAAEEALKRSEERFRTAFEHAPEGMALVTMDGRFVQGNPALCSLLKCDDSELQNLKLADITPQEDRIEEQRRLTKLIAGSCSILQFDRRIIPRSGEPVWTQATVSLLLREESPFCYLYQLHPIAAQDRVEPKENHRHNMIEMHEWMDQQKQLAQAISQSRNKFIASMSHELRTPLNAILGFAQMLDNENASPLTSEQRDLVKHIQRAGWRLLDLVNDALDLEKIESGQLQLSIEEIALQALIPECLQLVAKDADELHVTVTSGDIDYVVRADRLRLRQIILNFLSNAVKYNRAGGSVVITCKQHGATIRIAVSDTGPGLSAEQKGHLFEPFNRLGKEGGATAGSGIGLVITKRLVESMGGAVGVESRPGSGSIFWSDLPIGGRAKISPSSKKMPKKKAAQAAARTILCIEDNPVNMLLIQKIMQQRPEWTLITATTGQEGLDLAIKHSPDLILLDIGLPDICGLELIQRLRRHAITQRIPVAAVSANACPQYIEEALAKGFDRYITKPIRMPEFIDTVEALFANAESRPRKAASNQAAINAVD